MELIDGKKVSKHRREKIAGEVEAFTSKHGEAPGLAVVLVGEDPASQVYVRNKLKACKKVGIRSFERRLGADVSEEQLKQVIEELNNSPEVHGMLVQLPLPEHLNEDKVLTWIDPKKDADGLTAENMGLLWSGKPRAVPCTPLGVMVLLEYYDIELTGCHAVVVGRSNIVGKPMAQLLLSANATVSICHSKTRDLAAFTRQADVVVAAAGKPQMFGREHFQNNAVVIDVGIHRREKEDGKAELFGDVCFDEIQDHVRAATPVPGGVGPMTITMLLENTLRLAEAQA